MSDFCRLLLLLFLAFPWSWCHAGSRVTASATREQAIRAGVELEKSGRWGEAVERYETELKKHPGTSELELGLRRSRIHFAIERRYSDRSFLEKLAPLTRSQALGLFDELLATVESHYVEPVNVGSIVAHGTESVWYALNDHKFVAANLPDVSGTRVKQVQQTLHRRYWNHPVQNRTEARRIVEEVCRLCEQELGIRPGAVVMEYVFGGCHALDDYSSYLTPGRLDDLYGNIRGQFVGLGIEMKGEAGRGMLLVNVLPGSPAAEGGLLAGEHIVSIDGVDCREMSTDEAAGRLQGLEGTRVTLGIEGRGGKVREAAFRRRAVQIKSIPIATIVDRDAGVAYLQMTGFQETTAAELDAALARLKSQGMKSLVWDLRGNPGGLLPASVEVLDRFISDGVLVSTRGRTPDQNVTFRAHGSAVCTVPLVLLVDGDSASASEIVAGAIRDHNRGTIVGRTTYGKWSVQSIFRVRSSAGLRLTTAKFYSPRGENLSKRGVEPDVALPEPPATRSWYRSPTEINLAEDTDLQKGIEILRGQLAGR